MGASGLMNRIEGAPLRPQASLDPAQDSGVVKTGGNPVSVRSSRYIRRRHSDGSFIVVVGLVRGSLLRTGPLHFRTNENGSESIASQA
jgi:hypothetical protein